MKIYLVLEYSYGHIVGIDSIYLDKEAASERAQKLTDHAIERFDTHFWVIEEREAIK